MSSVPRKTNLKIIENGIEQKWRKNGIDNKRSTNEDHFLRFKTGTLILACPQHHP